MYQVQGRRQCKHTLFIKSLPLNSPPQKSQISAKSLQKAWDMLHQSTAVTTSFLLRLALKL